MPLRALKILSHIKERKEKEYKMDYKKKEHRSWSKKRAERLTLVEWR